MRNHADTFPSEVLSEIFRLAIGNPVSFKDSDNKSRASIILVCKSWSKTLLSTKSLWSSIVIEALDFWPWETGVRDRTCPADLSFLHHCLTLSYPLTLTITIRIEKEEDQRERAILPIAMELLKAHAIRWRSFSCIGPSWLFATLGGLERLHMPRLEALTMETYYALPSVFMEGQDIVLPPRLCEFDTNFDMPRLVPTWSGLTSLSSGFASNEQCYEILSLLSNVVTLAIIHVDSTQPYTRHEPIAMGSLRCLKLTKCAVACVLEDVHFPLLNEFHLSLCSHLSHHNDPIQIGRCSQRDPMREELLRSILERPGTLLRVLVIGDYRAELSTVVVPLLRATNDTLSVLRVYLQSQTYTTARFFLTSLTTDSDRPVLPNLSELHFYARNQSATQAFLMGGSMESMLVSRCSVDEVGRNVCSLRRLYIDIWGDGDELGDEDEDDDEQGIRGEEMYRHSSLALLLKELSDHRLPYSKRLDVEWVLGQTDLLKSGGTPDYFDKVFSLAHSS